MNTLQITYVIDDLPNVIVYNLSAVAQWGISFLPRQGRRPLQYKIDVAMLPRRVLDSEGNLVDSVVTAEYLFPTYEEAKKAIFISTGDTYSFQVDDLKEVPVEPKVKEVKPEEIKPEGTKQEEGTSKEIKDDAAITFVKVETTVQVPKVIEAPIDAPIEVSKPTVELNIEPKVESKVASKEVIPPNPNKWLGESAFEIPDIIQRIIIPNKDLEVPKLPSNKVNTKYEMISTDLYRPVSTLNVNEWSASCMAQKGIKTLKDLSSKTQAELTITLGRKASQDIHQALIAVGINLKP